MPRSKTKFPSKETPPAEVTQGKFWVTNDAPWGGFINVTINDNEKAEFHAWADENAQDVPVMLDDLMSEGMKYGCAYDRENQCYVVTLTGGLVLGSNLRCCVTTRAGTWAEANTLAAWKHYVFVQEDYGDLLTTGRKRAWG